MEEVSQQEVRNDTGQIN